MQARLDSYHIECGVAPSHQFYQRLQVQQGVVLQKKWCSCFGFVEHGKKETSQILTRKCSTPHPSSVSNGSRLESARGQV
eukprot:m.105103 g.105103  ORF g.105103 m.105103 type:complete len:80 (-) comp27620_c0_seq4:143-382(-)